MLCIHAPSCLDLVTHARTDVRALPACESVVGDERGQDATSPCASLRRNRALALRPLEPFHLHAAALLVDNWKFLSPPSHCHPGNLVRQD